MKANTFSEKFDETEEIETISGRELVRNKLMGRKAMLRVNGLTRFREKY